MTSLALLSDLEQGGALTTTSLKLPVGITREQYEALGALLGRMHETTKWAIGDYVIQGEVIFGQEAYQLIESLGISEESRQQIRSRRARDPSISQARRADLVAPSRRLLPRR